MRGFAVTAADNAIVAAAAKYRPKKPKKLQGQRFKDELERRPRPRIPRPLRRRSMLVTIEVRNDLPGTFAPMDVRFRGLSGHRADIAKCPLMTQSGHGPVQMGMGNRYDGLS